MKPSSVRVLGLAAGLALVCLPAAGTAADRGDEGYADERGRFITVGGVRKPAVGETSRNGWGLQPLGEPGTLKPDFTFANKPVFKAPPQRTPRHVFADADVVGVVVAPKDDDGLVRLADELAWHLSQMSAREVRVVPDEPKDGVPAIVLRRGGKAAFLRTSGTRLEAGGDGSAASHAVTYLLESLGCRYLWPGRTGKVIPRTGRIVLPDFDWTFTPELKIRGMRNSIMGDGRCAGLARCGLDADAYAKAYRDAFHDRAGNRDFYAWHGVNEPQETDGQWGWGHYFHDWWQTYGTTHPEFFALQPDGTRRMDLGPMTERATFCLSNPALAAETARRRLEDFRKLPQYQGLSICLPDGGWMGECLCESCRRLDPVNAPAADLNFPRSLRGTRRYVSLTDRLMTFNNRVAEAVAAEMPEKRLTCYVYSVYDEPPVRVKPHPALVFLSVAGDYTHAKTYDWARRNMAAWSHFGNPLLWRPNLFMGFRQAVPQNYARRLHEDFATFKCNNLLGTDMDCIYGHWAAQWINYYFAAKGHLNPDALGYEDLLADTCRAGFGKAADLVIDYLTRVERLTDEAARLEKGTEGYLTLSEKYGLRPVLEAAACAVKDDVASLGRVRFLMRALDWLDAERRLEGDWYAAKGDPVRIRAAQSAYFAFLCRQSLEDPLATVPVSLDGYYLYSKFLREVNVQRK